MQTIFQVSGENKYSTENDKWNTLRNLTQKREDTIHQITCHKNDISVTKGDTCLKSDLVKKKEKKKKLELKALEISSSVCVEQLYDCPTMYYPTGNILHGRIYVFTLFFWHVLRVKQPEVYHAFMYDMNSEFQSRFFWGLFHEYIHNLDFSKTVQETITNFRYGRGETIPRRVIVNPNKSVMTIFVAYFHHVTCTLYSDLNDMFQTLDGDDQDACKNYLFWYFCEEVHFSEIFRKKIVDDRFKSFHSTFDDVGKCQDIYRNDSTFGIVSVLSSSQKKKYKNVLVHPKHLAKRVDMKKYFNGYNPEDTLLLSFDLLSANDEVLDNICINCVYKITNFDYPAEWNWSQEDINKDIEKKMNKAMILVKNVPQICKDGKVLCRCEIACSISGKSTTRQTSCVHMQSGYKVRSKISSINEVQIAEAVTSNRSDELSSGVFLVQPNPSGAKKKLLKRREVLLTADEQSIVPKHPMLLFNPIENSGIPYEGFGIYEQIVMTTKEICSACEFYGTLCEYCRSVSQ